jgi:hypothetical protein
VRPMPTLPDAGKVFWLKMFWLQYKSSANTNSFFMLRVLVN